MVSTLLPLELPGGFLLGSHHPKPSWRQGELERGCTKHASKRGKEQNFAFSVLIGRRGREWGRLAFVAGTEQAPELR